MSQEQGYFTRIALNLGLAKRAPTVRMQTVNESAVSQAAKRAQLTPATASNSAEHTPTPTAAGSTPETPAPAAQTSVARTASQSAQRSVGFLGMQNTSPLISRGNESDITTVIPAAASFVGDLTMETSFVLQCVVRGNVTQQGDHQIVLTETGGIHGVLRAKTAVIGGKIEGDVFVERLFIRETGEIRGNVHYSSLAMAEGAVINGELEYVVPNVVGNADGAEHVAIQFGEMGALRSVPIPERVA